jgi:hypothetical protein
MVPAAFFFFFSLSDTGMVSVHVWNFLLLLLLHAAAEAAHKMEACTCIDLFACGSM